MAIGLLTAVGCFFSITVLKRKLGVDDSLDAFGLHGVGGIIGAVLTGIFASPAVMGQAPTHGFWLQMWHQIEGVLAVMAYSGAVTLIIGLVIKRTLGLRVSDEDEYQGLDLALHGEKIGD